MLSRVVSFARGDDVFGVAMRKTRSGRVAARLQAIGWFLAAGSCWLLAIGIVVAATGHEATPGWITAGWVLAGLGAVVCMSWSFSLAPLPRIPGEDMRDEEALELARAELRSAGQASHGAGAVP